MEEKRVEKDRREEAQNSPTACDCPDYHYIRIPKIPEPKEPDQQYWHPSLKYACGFDLLPKCAENEENEKVMQRLSLCKNTSLRAEWQKFVNGNQCSARPIIELPKPRDWHLVRMGVCYAPTLGCSCCWCKRMCLRPGEGLDPCSCLQLPIPADHHRRYRNFGCCAKCSKAGKKEGKKGCGASKKKCK